MNDTQNLYLPSALPAIERETESLGFSMASERRTGSLLRALAASKPSGELLELGTGTGIATAWILDGMDRNSKLVTVDNDETVVAIAKRHLAQDPRVTFHIGCGREFFELSKNQKYDFIFADTWPGKYDHLEKALRRLKPGGLYLIDDMSPQPSWPADHAIKVANLICALEKRTDLQLVKLGWSTGLMVATKKA